MMKTFKWIFILTLLVGCTSSVESLEHTAVPTVSIEPKLEAAATLEAKINAPEWVIIAEQKFELPTISTKFKDQSFGIATDIGGDIHLTHDGGKTWEFIQNAALSRVALEIVDENLIWHIGWRGPVIRSTDGGFNWEYLGSLPYSGHTEYTSFIDDKTGWAATTELQEYWITDDGAQTWTTFPLPDGMGTVAALHLRTAQDAYFLDLDGNLFITSDGGKTWNVGSLGFDNGWMIPELNHMAAMRFTNPSHGLITLNIIGDGSSEVFALRTTDGGETWSKEVLPIPMGMFHISRDGNFLTHVDLLQHDKITLLRSTHLNKGESYIIDQELSVRKIQEDVYLFAHAYPWRANSLAVVMGDHLVLVDTPWTPAATREMLTWLENQVGPKEIVAINTHFHLDNLGGNSYLNERDIPIYGSDLTVELLAERGQATLDQVVTWHQSEGNFQFAETIKNLTLTPPTYVFNLQDGLNLKFDGESVQVYYPGPAHAPDNVVVYFPDRKLLFGGCMIIGWDGIGNTTDADLAAWPESVRKLEQFDFDILVPGHGERLDSSLVEHTLNLLSNIP